MVLQVAESIGKRVLALCDVFGLFFIFLCEVLIALITTRLRLRKLFEQMRFVGVDSINIILLTGAFSGAVLALQSYIGFKRFGAEEFIGPVVALSLTRELGPVLTGLMVTGRAGSAIAAEIGTMQITEQIDALKTLTINVNQYLMVPRILGSVIIMPFLTVFSMMCGIIGGYVISVYVLNLNGEQYISGIKSFLELSDITGGLVKSSVFGLILSWVGCYKGYYTSGGAKGVGIATTQSVVTASILILISNYFLATMLFK
ncbi:ABC transporter permease [bacterium]|nr:ABC transporter permease [bacterium]